MRYVTITSDTHSPGVTDGRDIVYDFFSGEPDTRPLGTFTYRKKPYLVYSAEAFLVEIAEHTPGLPVMVWPTNIPDDLEPEAEE